MYPITLALRVSSNFSRGYWAGMASNLIFVLMIDGVGFQNGDPGGGKLSISAMIESNFSFFP